MCLLVLKLSTSVAMTLQQKANLNRNCNTTKEVFICVKRDPNKLPLLDIGVVWGFEMPANVGYEVITLLLQHRIAI